MYHISLTYSLWCWAPRLPLTLCYYDAIRNILIYVPYGIIKEFHWEIYLGAELLGYSVPVLFDHTHCYHWPPCIGLQSYQQLNQASSASISLPVLDIIQLPNFCPSEGCASDVCLCWFCLVNIFFYFYVVKLINLFFYCIWIMSHSEKALCTIHPGYKVIHLCDLALVSFSWFYR